MNYSKQREQIYETLKGNVVHPSAEYIYQILKNENSDISLATVYRNLNSMAKNGRVKKIEGLEDKAHYDHNTFEHYHFICEKCKKIFDISSQIAPEVIAKTQEATGFKIKKHDVVFQGICLECMNKQEAER